MPVEATDGGDIVGIPRHRFDRSVPAHLIDHGANMRAALRAGCDRVLAIGSVGLPRRRARGRHARLPRRLHRPRARAELRRRPRGHSAPGFDPDWRAGRDQRLGRASGTELEDGGVYWQTIGPRFETPAEIRLIAAHADVVGMTIASECVVAGELGLAYAAVCVVDNLANGIGPSR